MQIKTLSGHITETEKKHLKLMFDMQITEAKIGRKIYLLKQNADFYDLKVMQNERHCIGADLKKTVNLHSFKLIQ